MTRSLKEAECASLKAFREKSTRRKTPGGTTCPPGIRVGKCPPWCHTSAGGAVVAGCGLVPGVSAAPQTRKTAGRALRAFSTCFSSSRGKQGDEAALHGDPAGPLSAGPHSYFAGGACSGSACGGGPWNGGVEPPQKSGVQRAAAPAAGGLGRTPPAPCPGAAPSLPGAQHPHHAHTDSESTPWAVGSPISGLAREGKAEGGQGLGRGTSKRCCGGPGRPSAGASGGAPPGIGSGHRK